MADARAKMDVDITTEDVAALASTDSVAEFFQRRGYDTAKRAAMTTEAIDVLAERARETPVFIAFIAYRCTPLRAIASTYALGMVKLG